MNIVFVCTGNTCRSPMAQALAIQQAQKQGLDCHIISAGLAAYRDAGASENAIEAMREIGVDISGHRSQPLTPSIIRQADIIVPMTGQHRQLLTAMGVPAEKLRSIGEIPDPYGGDLDVYRQCRDTLQQAVTALLSQL